MWCLEFIQDERLESTLDELSGVPSEWDFWNSVRIVAKLLGSIAMENVNLKFRQWI